MSKKHFTLDEAIEHCYEVSKKKDICKECADEHLQLAKWLKELKTLRQKKTRKNDEVTGAKLYKGFQVHHLDLNPDNYSKLDEENFACLNRQTHDFIHWAFRYYDKDPDGFIERFEKILKKMHEINK